MSEDFINISRSLDTLTLAQVAEKINVKDIAANKHDLIFISFIEFVIEFELKN